MQIARLCARTKPRGPACQRGRLRLELEPLPRVVPDRLQHPVATVPEAEEPLLDERLQGVEVGVGDLLGSFERASAGEDGEAGEELLLLVRSSS